MDDQYEKTIHIPFCIRAGRIEPLDGVPLPRLREGTVGHITISADAFEKEEETTRFEGEARAAGLPAGTELLFNMMSRLGWPNHLAEHARSLTLNEVSGWLRGRYVSATLLDPLEIQLRGTKKPVLRPARCRIPSIGKEANSINHAYTLISEQFEPERMSHTANVFQKVFFRDEGTWKRLEILRMRAEASALSRSKPSQGTT